MKYSGVKILEPQIAPANPTFMLYFEKFNKNRAFHIINDLKLLWPLKLCLPILKQFTCGYMYCHWKDKS